jgi:hypothetical protein
MASDSPRSAASSSLWAAGHFDLKKISLQLKCVRGK